ncbi:hypothetical protein ACUXCC_005088 [Cytobacillus horneckiae]|uniref:hypothetical protein n=1 Tax=Cytobacillus horneckiae TaxID=549687 RepID=UPI0019D253F4|nr:hypothetical protein [Cytobacillus horneckiae]MBN6884865.1 hypothetical protein [Cytobacillus horneckiae]MCM3179390.1 hypothetical protein [Cytobacillus horneckiae]
MKTSKKIRNSIAFFLLLIIGMILINLWASPKGAISLHKKMSNSDDYQELEKLFYKDSRQDLSQEEYEEIHMVLKDIPEQLNEVSIFEYADKWLIVNKSPDGSNKILSIEVLDKEDGDLIEKILDSGVKKES